MLLPSTGEAAEPCYPEPRYHHLAALSAWAEKMLLTDFCNRMNLRAPVDRSNPARRLSPRETVRAEPRVRRQDRLAASRLQVETRSTTHLQLRLCRSSLARMGEACFAGYLAAALSTACGVDGQPLTLPLALLRDAISRARWSTRTLPERLPSKSRPFPARSAFPRQVPDRPASACLSRPPPFSRLCHRRAGFRRAFAPRSALADGS